MSYRKTGLRPRTKYVQGFSPLWAVVVALIPAVFALWSTRQLIPLIDDPALAERLVASRARSGVAFGACFVATAALAPGHIIWTLPLLTVANATARYRLRKALYRETWSLPEYLIFFTRLVIGVFGFWLLVSMTPWIIELAAPYDWIAAVVAGVTLVTWIEIYGTALCAIVGAMPVSNASTVARFEEMVASCGLRRVDLMVIDMGGGAFANAFALPSVTRPIVLTTSTLLDHLDADETAAIFAHELAHIEHFNVRRLRLMRFASLTLIAAAVLISPALHRYAPAIARFAPAVWPVVLIWAAALHVRRRQRHETASDLRALALAGNPDALIRALIKLHTFARLPRRLDLRAEQQASHPSLARRIQAIRAASGSAPAALGAAAQFTASNGVASVTFLDDRLIWNEDPAANHIIDYGRLKMLRVDVRGSREVRLIAVDGAARRWEMALRPDDVARAQATLDIVDARLGSGTTPPPPVPQLVGRVFALIGLLLAAVKGHLTVAAVAWMVVIAPVAALTSAAGAASLGSAAQIAQAGGTVANGGLLIAIALAICGASLVGIAFLNRRELYRAWTARAVGALAMVSALSWGAVLLSGISFVELHRSLHAWPFTTAMTFATAGALAIDAGRARRIAAATAASIGLLGVTFASAAFLERFSRDPFVAHADDAQTSRLVLDKPFATMTTSFGAHALHLSPDGHHTALVIENDDETSQVEAGPVGSGTLSTFNADDARFVDNTRLLLLRRERTTTTLSLVDFASNAREVWKTELAVRNARMLWNRQRGEWSVLGWSDKREIIRHDGTIAGPATRLHRWADPSAPNHILELLSSADNHVLAVEREFTSPPLAGLLPLRIAPLANIRGRQATILRLIADAASGTSWLNSQVDVNCLTGLANPDSVLCAAFDGVTTRVFDLDPSRRAISPAAALNGHFYPGSVADEGSLFGWARGGSVLIQTSTRAVMRLDASDGTFVDAVAVAVDRIGVASSGRDGAIVRFYNRGL
jgi:Zn-dependent protease with chaperone function